MDVDRVKPKGCNYYFGRCRDRNWDYGVIRGAGWRKNYLVIFSMQSVLCGFGSGLLKLGFRSLVVILHELEVYRLECPVISTSNFEDLSMKDGLYDQR